MTAKRFSRAALFAAMAFGLTACLDPEDYESDPVEVPTSRGVVTCQLYTLDKVLWDRAIHRPETMTVDAADAVCVAEGRRLEALR